MANNIISQGAYGMSMSELEREALREHIRSGLAALNQREFPEKLQKAIEDGLENVKATYIELTDRDGADEPSYAKLIEDTLQSFEDKSELRSLRYREYLRVVVKLIEDMMIVISLTFGIMPGYSAYVSERYDILLNLEHKISNTLASN